MISDSINGQVRKEIAAYQICLEEKRHYDGLTWTIGAVIMAAVGFLISRIPEITGPNHILGRLFILFFNILVLGFWFCIYERNRIWAEAANERAREFERKWRLAGITLDYMKVGTPENEEKKEGFRPMVILRNRDENDNPWGEIDRPVKSINIPMHKVIYSIMASGVFLTIAACILL